MDDNLDLVGLPPEEIVVRLLERRPDGYGLNDGTHAVGPRRWWTFWWPKQEDAVVVWRRHVEECRARRRAVESLQREPSAKS